MDGANMTHSQRLGVFGSELRFDAIPRDVIEKMKLHLLDTVAVAYAGARDPLGRSLVDLALRGQPTGRATMIGFPHKTSIHEAAFVNTSFGHAKDFDDAHTDSIGHPTVIAGPAVLALAEAYRLDGKSLLAALIFGIEVCTRLGQSGSAAMARRGIPPMSMCGVFGAAAASAKLLELDAAGIAAAIGISSSFASGSHEWVAAGTNAKTTSAGWAARSGIIAARMAKDGFAGSLTTIEGSKGLLSAMAGPGVYDPEEPIAELGTRWETRNLSIKGFASCQGTQPYIVAALKLRERHNIDPSAIERIEVVVGAGIGRTLSEPHDMKRSPPDAYSAKFSIPFCVAVALQYGEFRLSHLEGDWPTAKLAEELAARVHHRIDPAYDIGTAEQGYVSIALKDGRTFALNQRTSEIVYGIDRVTAKFDDCAGWLLSTQERAEITDLFMALDDVEDVSSIMAKLGPVASRNGTANDWLSIS